MHELSICLSLIEILETQAEQHHFHKIKTLSLEIGDLAGIEVEALKFNFPIAASRSIAKNAKLNIISTPGKGFCKSCQSKIRIKNMMSACPKCYSYDYRILEGKEMRILNMEVE